MWHLKGTSTAQAPTSGSHKLTLKNWILKVGNVFPLRKMLSHKFPLVSKFSKNVFICIWDFQISQKKRLKNYEWSDYPTHDWTPASSPQAHTKRSCLPNMYSSISHAGKIVSTRSVHLWNVCSPKCLPFIWLQSVSVNSHINFCFFLNTKQFCDFWTWYYSHIKPLNIDKMWGFVCFLFPWFLSHFIMFC